MTKELTKTILELIAVGALVAVVGGVTHGRASGKLGKAFIQYSRGRVRQTLKRLRLQRYIAYDPKDEKSPILLTEKGMCRLASWRLCDIFIQRKKRWDYLWRVVIFDVPERRRLARQHLHRELLSAGLYPLQRSVFVSPYECTEAMLSLCNLLHIRSHVVVFTASSLGAKEKDVRRFFFVKS